MTLGICFGCMKLRAITKRRGLCRRCMKRGGVLAICKCSYCERMRSKAA